MKVIKCNHMCWCCIGVRYQTRLPSKVSSLLNPNVLLEVNSAQFASVVSCHGWRVAPIASLR